MLLEESQGVRVYESVLKYVISVNVIFQQGTDSEVKSEPLVVLPADPVTVYIATDLYRD